MDYLYVKSIHIIFVVSWFAALFYIVRLFIYTAEAQKKEEPDKKILTEQMLIMQRRLWYIIGWPGMAGTTIFGGWMLGLNMRMLALPWMWLKLIAVALLLLYHWQCQRILNQQKKGEFRFTSFRLRMFNELATVMLVAIVFLVVVKSTSGLMWGVLGLIVFAGLLLMLMKIYKKNLEKQAAKNTEVQPLKKDQS